MSPLTFAAVHTVARCLSFETLGAERHPEALSTLTIDLFDALPEGRQDDVWAALGQRIDRMNEFLAEGAQVPSRDGTTAPGNSPGRTVLPGWKPDRSGAGRRESVTDAIREVPLAHAVEALTGETVPRSGVLRCPLPDHDDGVPSFTVYADNHFHCFGCGAHGSAFDIAAAVWQLDVRRDFSQVRDQLADVLLGVAA